MLELREATKMYGHLEVLHETSLAVCRGEIWVPGLRLRDPLRIMCSAS